MNVLRWGANMIEGASPGGLILVGTMLAIASPPVRRGLRSAAVTATRGVMMVVGAIQGTAATFRENIEDIAAEAKSPINPASDDESEENCTIAKAAKNHGHRLAVAATAGAMAIRDEMRGIVEEAKYGQTSTLEDPGSVGAEQLTERHQDAIQVDGEEPSNEMLEPDGLEASTVDLGSKPSKKRIRGRQP